MTEEGRTQLEQAIGKWLESAPGREDVVAYYRNLPQENWDLPREAADRVARITLQRKDSALAEKGFADFLKLSQSVQLYWLSAFRAYSTASVLRKLGQQYPGLGSLPVDQAFVSEISELLGVFDAAVATATAPEYLTARTYLVSLQRLFTAEQLIGLAAELDVLFVQDGLPFDEQREQSAEETRAWLDYYKKLQFLPPEEAERLSQFASYFERSDLNQRLVIIFSLFKELGLDLEKLEAGLWLTYQQQLSRELLVAHEATVRSATVQAEPLKEIMTHLMQSWKVDIVVRGEALERTRRLLAEATSLGYKLDIRSILQDNLYIEAELDTLDVPFLLFELSTARSDAAAEAHIAQLVASEQVPEERRPIVRQYLHQLAAAVKL
jgi:hypothetical protein